MTNSNFNIVADTNVLIASFSRKSQFHWFYQDFRNNKFNLSMTNDILTEYEEKFFQFYDEYVAGDVIESLLTSQNVFLYACFYNWNLIDADPDDNKFVNCAVVSNADYIVTNDRHFNILKRITFPKIVIVNINEFKKILHSEI